MDAAKPVIFVSEKQLQTLLNEITGVFQHLDLTITNYYREIGLVVTFPDHPRLRPRYLGTSTSRARYNEMEANAPKAIFRPAGEKEVPPPDQRSLEAFQAMMEETIELNKAKNKATKAKKNEQRVQRQQNMVRQLKRAQRYLGLRPKRDNGMSRVD